MSITVAIQISIGTTITDTAIQTLANQGEGGEMTDYLFFGAAVSKIDDDFQDYLQRAHTESHHPLCLCKSPPVPMYVSRVNNSYILKRMPNKGSEHHPDCDSYEIPVGLSGRGLVQNRAIVEDHDSGLTSLKLAFPLSKLASSRDPVTASAGEKKTVHADPAKLSMRAYFEYLYEEAGLTRWSPKMKGKRNWHIVRHHLLQASQNKLSRRSPLAECTWVPEVFSVDKKDEIAGRRRRFLSGLKAEKGKTPFALMIGEIKAIETSRFGGKLIIKHMPDAPIYMAEDVFGRVNKAFAAEIALFEEDESIHLLAMMTFYLSASGNPQVETITFITVDQNWLPFESLDERELLERLVSDRRYFIKSMRYNLSSTDVVAAAIITDTKPDPTAFYIVPMGATESFYDELDELCKSTGIPSSIWDANEEAAMSLPPAGRSTLARETSGGPDSEESLPGQHYDDYPEPDGERFDMYADEDRG
ncbi:hypothetical protein C0068_01380 [Zhongshania marina]|uniref:DUF1173 domain-containing protein n=2 Tax=Zhongshania marina TaxID=2304603 RepID=A0A2S4HKD8_9GAMM|nr:hypothetical protein C0068_01380 [Marortus luteolus]